MKRCLLVAVLLLGCSDGGDVDDAEMRGDSIVGGRETHTHPEVGLFDLGGGFCTATLVGSRAILTAAHCLGHTPDGEVRGMRFVLDGGASFDVTRVRAFGRWRENAEPAWRSRDVALALLARAVPKTTATPMALASRWPSWGTTLTVYGYGCTDRATGEGGGTKRSAEVHYNAWWSLGLSGRDRLCPGDSGGPLVDEGRSVLLGVNSGFIRGVDYWGDVAALAPEIRRVLDEWGAR